MNVKMIVSVFLISGIASFQSYAQKKEETGKKEERKEVVGPPAGTWKPDMQMGNANNPSPGNNPNMPQPFVFGGGQDRTSSSLTLNKSFDNESLNKKTNFVVEKGQRFLSFSVEGSCEKGSIEVIFTDPSGEKTQNLLIDPSAHILWTKTLPLFEEGSGNRNFPPFPPENKQENEPLIKQEYIGSWTIEVIAKNATGNYSVRISTR